jgi:hypothetical protein
MAIERHRVGGLCGADQVINLTADFICRQTCLKPTEPAGAFYSPRPLGTRPTPIITRPKFER